MPAARDDHKFIVAGADLPGDVSACLTAAAPDLLEAARGAFAYFSCDPGPESATAARLRAAIAKAEGRA